jgi:hypothetical protein
MTEPVKDGADVCLEFIDDIVALFKKHDVQVVGQWEHLVLCDLVHADAENGWTLDFETIQSLTKKKPQG